ncbi:SprT-like family-domain-containing protein [Mycena galericulata]|nr:SprT-like family-domain-containing protein [Mycena galericulata]
MTGKPLKVQPGGPGPEVMIKPTRRDVRSTGSATTKLLSKSSKSMQEVVPDSEEERVRARDDPDIIDISSDSDEEEAGIAKPIGDPVLRVPGAWLGDSGASPATKTTLRTPVRAPATPTSSRKKIVPSKRPQLAESASSTDVAQDQVVVLVDPAWSTPKSNLKVPIKHVNKNATPSTNKSARGTHQLALESDSEVEVLDVPVRSPRSKKQTKPITERRQPLFEDDDSETSDLSEEESTVESIAGDVPNKYARYYDPPPRSVSTKRSLERLKKLSAEAQQELREQNSRVIYAEQVYSYLNRVVFKDGLPSLTKIELKWNKKLLTTAGRARFHRDRNGVETAEIHLAPKVVDSDERIRNTLGHEMCHLACWMIDKEIKEAHGKIFRKWARRVEQKDANITISIRHTYEISYKYNWKCASCDEITGRHSNSIDPSKRKCSECTVGILVPLFELPKKKGPDAELSKMSKMAAAKSQSPCPNPPRARPRPASVISIDSSDEDEDTPSVHVQREIYLVPDSDSECEDKDNEITDLARRFEQGVTISHKICLHAVAKRAKRT